MQITLAGIDILTILGLPIHEHSVRDSLLPYTFLSILNKKTNRKLLPTLQVTVHTCFSLESLRSVLNWNIGLILNGHSYFFCELSSCSLLISLLEQLSFFYFIVTFNLIYFFVLLKYLIFMWLSLPGFFFITLVFSVMHREAIFSLNNKNIHFALVLVSFHFLHFMFFSL